VNNTIFLIVGESGCGKTTIVSALEKQRGLKSIQSYTTRPKRSENEYGHLFVSTEEFTQLKDLVAYTKFNGFEYGATSEQVENNDLYVIDKRGIDFFKQAYKGTKQIKVIYIKSSISTRVERMEQRGDKFANIMERIVNDVTDFKGVSSMADLIVENNSDTKLTDCVHKIWEFIRKEENCE